MRNPAIAVFLASLIALGWRAGEVGIGTAWVDPVAQIQAQDETVYANTAQGMAEGRGWLTPKFAGRLALYKPPLSYWASGLSVKLLGWGPLRLRLPSILAGAGMATIVFLWIQADAGLWAGIAGALLVVSSHLVFVMSRVALTDALLGVFTLAALWIMKRDPRWERLSSPLWFGACCGMAMMTKSIAAGIAVLAALILCAESRTWPPFRRIMLAAGVILAIVLPWHVYQYFENPNWFWNEYVISEHLMWGLTPPGQTTAEAGWAFYGKRLVMLDPFLVLAGAVGAWRNRNLPALALVQAVLIATLAFQYRNASYLLPIYPALAILAAGGLPAKVSLPGAVVVALLKLAAVPATWALPVAPEFVNESYAQLEQQAAARGDRELIVIGPDDQFYATLLHFKRVRYAFEGIPSRTPAPVDFERLGITLTVEQFNNLASLTPEFERRLRAFDLDSTEPIGTAILYADDADAGRLLAAHPQTDFYAPAQWVGLDRGVHNASPGSAGRIWLRAK